MIRAVVVMADSCWAEKVPLASPPAEPDTVATPPSAFEHLPQKLIADSSSTPWSRLLHFHPKLVYSFPQPVDAPVPMPPWTDSHPHQKYLVETKQMSPESARRRVPCPASDWTLVSWRVHVPFAVSIWDPGVRYADAVPVHDGESIGGIGGIAGVDGGGVEGAWARPARVLRSRRISPRRKPKSLRSSSESSSLSDANILEAVWLKKSKR